MKISFITTIYNAEKEIIPFLDSLFSQIRLPDEIIIVDGGSSDKTMEKIFNQNSKFKKIKMRIITKKGNRSVGRNEAVRQAINEIILCADGDNVLDKNWVNEIIKPFEKKDVDVVAGYYKGLAKNAFEKALIPYVLVMEDKINPDNFLPASRSMAFTKRIWEKVGGFPQNYSHNEDYLFAKKLQKEMAKIIFAKNAIVYWRPRKNLSDAFYMFYRFALGDAQAKIFRPKVLFIFIRYLFGVAIVMLAIQTQSSFLFFLIIDGVLLYLLWAIVKNFQYVLDWRAILFLPVLQLASDIAVMIGTVKGIYTGSTSHQISE